VVSSMPASLAYEARTFLTTRSPVSTATTPRAAGAREGPRWVEWVV